MTQPLLIAACFLLCLTLSARIAAAGNMLLLENGNVLVLTQDNRLQLWRRGEKRPIYTTLLKTNPDPKQSLIVTLERLEAGEIILVGPHSLELFDLDLNPISEKATVYEGVEFNITQMELPAAVAKLDKFANYILQTDFTSAALLSRDRKALYLGTLNGIAKISVKEIQSPKNDDLLIGDSWFFTARDGGPDIEISRKGDITSKIWPIDSPHKGQVTAAAVCGKTLIVGTEKGRVEFIQEDDDSPSTLRIRQVSVDPATGESGRIIVAGCIGNKRGFTVSEEMTNGQIQIWNLDSKALIQAVRSSSGGHPGLALGGLAAIDGTQMLTIGTQDVRLWNISNDRLVIAGIYPLLPRPGPKPVAAAPAAGGGFIVWDGWKLLFIPQNGGAATIYAGS